MGIDTIDKSTASIAHVLAGKMLEDVTALIAKHIQKAIMEERTRCSKIASNFSYDAAKEILFE